jgi:hypothetical protein
MSDSIPTKAISSLSLGSDDRPAVLERRKSQISLDGILQFLDRHSEFSSPEEETKKQCVIDFVKGIDRDQDGNISSDELCFSLLNFYDNAVRANEDALRATSKIRKYKRATGGLIALTVVLLATVFGTSFAAARLAKDTQVSNRALLTKDNQPVGTNLNEVDIPLAALAFVPSSVASKVKELVLSDDNGNIYHRTNQAIDINPGKSVTLRTIEGDIISWDAANDSKSTVKIELVNGTAWDMSSLCAACTATSLVADDEVDAALDNFYAITRVVVNDGNRIRRKTLAKTSKLWCR